MNEADTRAELITPQLKAAAQAKIYAQKLNLKFAYSANGKEIYQIDMKELL